MGLITTKELLRDAQASHYAVPAFNVENMECIQGVVWAAKEMNVPVIIQTTPSSVRYAGVEFFAAGVEAILRETGVMAALHLDHGSSYELAARAMKAGYTSVMFDGSKLPMEENIAWTKKVVELGHIFGVSVEEELGCIGGKEDDTQASGMFTEACDAEQFVRKTGVDSLAVAIGTAHGVYKGIPHIDIGRLKEIRRQVEIPLVLHGTSGVPEETVRECIQNGMCKVNYATDLRCAFTEAVRIALGEEPLAVDPKRYLGTAREAVKEVAKERIRLVMTRTVTALS